MISNNCKFEYRSHPGRVVGVAEENKDAFMISGKLFMITGKSFMILVSHL